MGRPEQEETDAREQILLSGDIESNPGPTRRCLMALSHLVVIYFFLSLAMFCFLTLLLPYYTLAISAWIGKLYGGYSVVWQGPATCMGRPICQ
jgi:hypothetical protein